MTYEENLQRAKSLGYPDACCLACGNFNGDPNKKACRDCQAETPAFNAAVVAFMKCCEGAKQ